MPFLLPDIKGPSQLKGLSLRELNQLAQEIRECIIKTVSLNGGHLAPSLGVVELTLALHSLFDSPKDKFIWDVGHQCYAHKLLTGRYHEFFTLRKAGGISGFPKRQESLHDTIDTGHSGTSISTAIGMAFGRDLLLGDEHIIAIIGDGALGSGMALEALNTAGAMKSPLIIILNDNKMSIAPNVGALSHYLSLIRSEPLYNRFQEDLSTLIGSIPSIGRHVLNTTERLKNSLKHLFVPGMLFEELGLTYLGPVDGHQIGALREMMGYAKKLKKPALLHILTQKGKGYPPAEEEPSRFHGTPPFYIKTGSTKKGGKLPSYTEVFSKYLMELAALDPQLVAITAAMPDGTGLAPFAQEYPHRFFDVGIAEQHATTLAAGLALQGLKPILCLYSTFLQRSYDQVIHDLALQRLPVVIALDRAGLVGEDGETHQGLFDLSFLRIIPNLLIMAPGDEEELGHMLKTGLAYQEGPVIIRYPRGPGPGKELTQKMELIPIGKGRLLKEGSRICLLAIGSTVGPALKARELLKKAGYWVSVVDARFVKPLDRDLIKGVVLKHEYLITLEENTLLGGFGSGVLELLNEEDLLGDIKVKRIGLPDTFIEHGSQHLLRERYGLLPTSIVKGIKEFCPLSPKNKGG